MSFNKWYFDELYDKTFVAGTIGFSKLLSWFDNTIVDGIVNGSASVTKAISAFSGKFDNVVVDGFVNSVAYLSGFLVLIFRKFQTGKVQTYVVLVIFSIVIFLFLFKSLAESVIMGNFPILSFVTFLPILGMAIILILPRNKELLMKSIR